MFIADNKFNGDIGEWDVSNVESMTRMFYRESFIPGVIFIPAIFNRDIGKWKTGKVTNMESMFYVATNFDQDIFSWVVSKVANHDNIFEGCNIRDDHKPNF